MLRPHLRLQQFELHQRIGIGGDGEVWRVRCSKGKEYALKARPENQHIQSFRKEFERLRILRLPHIIRVHEMGIDKGYVFYTMDLVRGIHFHQAIQESNSFEEKINLCIQLSLQLSLALSAMHDFGLVHLDLKPNNVMVSKDNKVTLLDFGQACSLGEIQLQNNPIGTLAYMSPEQRISHSTHQKTDCFALGICIYQALTGSIPKDIHREGMPTPLILINPNIPLSISHLVERLLQLDPDERPSAIEVHDFLRKVLHKHPLPSIPWPEPPNFIGSAQSVLNKSQVIYGALGSGSRRMIKEARRLWHLQGYRSVAGHCKDIDVCNPFVQILESLFFPLSKEERRQLAGKDAYVLKKIAPNLPIVGSQKIENARSPKKIADVLLRLFSRISPIAIVIWDLHKADRYTYNVIKGLCSQTITDVKIWISSRKAVDFLPSSCPPKWTIEQERAVWDQLAPKEFLSPLKKGGFALENTLFSPLHSCFRVWQAIEKWKNPNQQPLHDLQIFGSLGVLETPFPKEVAKLLCPQFSSVLEQKFLVPIQSPHGVWYEWSNHSIKMILEEQKEDRKKNRLAAQAWQRFMISDIRHSMVAMHKIRAKEDPSRQMIQALDFAINSNNYPQAYRWISYIKTLNHIENHFTVEYAKAMVNLYHNEGRVQESHFSVLQKLIQNESHQLQYEALILANDLRSQMVTKNILRKTQRLIEKLHNIQPQLGLELYRTIALALLQQGKWEQGNQICGIGATYAKNLLTEFHGPPLRILQEKYLLLQITQSAILTHSMQYQQAIEVCKTGLQLSQQVDMQRSTLGFLINSSICYLEKGDRNSATQHIRQSAKNIQFGKPRADSRAYSALIQAQLAIERGESDQGFDKLDEAISLGQTLQDESLLKQAWSLMLDVSISSGRSKEGKRAIRAYKKLSTNQDRDHWPAAMAKWYWMTGQLEEAQKILDAPRSGYALSRLLAEKGRIFLVSGLLREASREAQILHKHAKKYGHSEFVLFAEMIRCVAELSSDSKMSTLLEKCEKSEWTDLYIGSLYFDLIRRKLRKQPIEEMRQIFQERAESKKHFLFCELSKKELW